MRLKEVLLEYAVKFQLQNYKRKNHQLLFQMLYQTTERTRNYFCDSKWIIN